VAWAAAWVAAVAMADSSALLLRRVVATVAVVVAAR
jgi:hypothetical protein